MAVGGDLGVGERVRADLAPASGLVQLDKGVPHVEEVTRQLGSRAILPPHLAAHRGKVVAYRAAASHRLGVLEVIAPVGGYSFEDASVKFALLAMKVSTWSRITGKSR